MSRHDYTPDEVAARLKESMRHAGIRQADLAKALGISPSTLSGHLDGKKYISPEVAAMLSDLHGYNIEFLVAGKGRLFGSEERDAVIMTEGKVCSDFLEFEIGMGDVCLGDIADGIGRDYFKLKVKLPDRPAAVKEIYSLYYDPTVREGQRVRLIVREDGNGDDEEVFEVPFGDLSLDEALRFSDYVHFVLSEDRKMGRMGEMAYRFQHETKRRDDVSLISFKRASDGLILIDVNDELFDNKGMMDFIGRMMNQEAHMGTYTEARSKMQMLFACLSAVFSYNNGTSVDYEGLVHSITTFMHEYEVGLVNRVSKHFSSGKSE